MKLLLIIIALMSCQKEWVPQPCKNKMPILETEQPDSMSVPLGTRISVYFTAQDNEGDSIWFSWRTNLPESKHITVFDQVPGVEATGHFSFRTDDVSERSKTFYVTVYATDGNSCNDKDSLCYKIHVF